jgi:hypothetical protein
MNWIKRLEAKWGVTGGQVFLILLVFALTGTSIVFLKRPLVAWIDPQPENRWVFNLLYYILIFPIYNLVLLIYGWIFGMFNFFWEKEKKLWKRIRSVFSRS